VQAQYVPEMLYREKLCSDPEAAPLVLVANPDAPCAAAQQEVPHGPPAVWTSWPT
jgi:hypothetical protein